MRPEVKYRVIYRHRDKYSISEMCIFFEVSRSGYYGFVRRMEKPAKDLELSELIRECQIETKQTYGYRRVAIWLERKGVHHNPKTILRVMNKYNLLSVVRRKRYCKPAVPYTNADLNWQNKQSRSSVEMSDHSSRPAIADGDVNISAYDTVYIGFPVWWYIAPTIINTFIEKYDFSGKRIILFATSGGSRFGKAVDNLKASAPNAEIIEGQVNPSTSDIQTLANM